METLKPLALCNCLTKTPEIKHHSKTCAYRMDFELRELEYKILHNFVLRRETTLKECIATIDALKVPIEIRLKRHGFGVASGPHEIYGILAEEMDELLDEVRSNDHAKLYEELVDIAIGAIFGMISMKARIEFERDSRRLET